MTRSDPYLILSDDEATWKFDRKLIFLGEWCLKFNRRHIWKSLNANIARPYGTSSESKKEDKRRARSIEHKLLPWLCQRLNEYHRTCHDERFWKIVLGHWFRRYIDVMLNRVNTIEQCLSENKIAGVSLYPRESYELAVQDSHYAIWAFNDGTWNNVLASHILNFIAPNCPVEIIAPPKVSGFNMRYAPPASTVGRLALRCAHQMVSRVFSFLSRSNDAFFISSYLAKSLEIKLQLLLGQFPRLWFSIPYQVIQKPNHQLRNQLASQFSEGMDSLENIVGKMLFKLLPVCYLEGFEDLIIASKNQRWPKTPKLIFTSNSFDTDEVFKLWTACKVEAGAVYFVGQHGNNYGTYEYIYPTVEEETSDYFLTWGWCGDVASQTSLFAFKENGLKFSGYDPFGGLLLIEACLNHRITTWDGIAEFSKYFEDQKDFVSTLMRDPRTKLNIRLHAASTYLDWGENERWREFSCELNIVGGDANILNLIKSSRLVVYSYDSTGALETLSANIPTIMFWIGGLDHLRDDAKPYYQELIEVGILHLSSISAATMVNKVWTDIDGWWGTEGVQNARTNFCRQYVKSSQNPLGDLHKLLRDLK